MLIDFVNEFWVTTANTLKVVFTFTFIIFAALFDIIFIWGIFTETIRKLKKEEKL